MFHIISKQNPANNTDENSWISFQNGLITLILVRLCCNADQGRLIRPIV